MVFLCVEPDIVETIIQSLSNSSRTRRQVVTQLVHMGLVDNAKELKKPKYVICLVSSKITSIMCKYIYKKKNLKASFHCLVLRKGTQIVLWTQEQELELEMLFEEYKDSDGIWNLLSSSSPKYFDQTLPSFSVAAPVRDSAFKEAFIDTDVLGNIMKKLTAKRSRARVVDKLLSMGLVSERRELYKKRSRGGGQRKSSGKVMVSFIMQQKNHPARNSHIILTA